MNLPPANESDDELQFLQDLVKENASIAGDVLQVGDNLWAVHGFIPVDGDVLMGEFGSYDEAMNLLAQLPRRTRRARRRRGRSTRVVQRDDERWRPLMRWVTAATAKTMTPATSAGHGRFTASVTQPMKPATARPRGQRRSCRSSVNTLALAIA